MTFLAQGGGHVIWPVHLYIPDAPGDNGVLTYDIFNGEVGCVASGHDEIPDLGKPFDFFHEADTDGVTAAFIGKDDKFINFGGFTGVYVRSLDGQGPILPIATSVETAPGGGVYNSFGDVSIDADLVTFMACIDEGGICDRVALCASFLTNGVPGEVFEIISTDDQIDGREIIGFTVGVNGRDENQLALKVRWTPFDSSLYVVTIEPTGCPADINADGELDILDFIAFQAAWQTQEPIADCDMNRTFNVLDFVCYQQLFQQGCN
jgi:hypothetical protein